MIFGHHGHPGPRSSVLVPGGMGYPEVLGLRGHLHHSTAMPMVSPITDLAEKDCWAASEYTVGYIYIYIHIHIQIHIHIHIHIHKHMHLHMHIHTDRQTDIHTNKT